MNKNAYYSFIIFVMSEEETNRFLIAGENLTSYPIIKFRKISSTFSNNV